MLRKGKIHREMTRPSTVSGGAEYRPNTTLYQAALLCPALFWTALYRAALFKGPSYWVCGQRHCLRSFLLCLRTEALFKCPSYWVWGQRHCLRVLHTEFHDAIIRNLEARQRYSRGLNAKSFVLWIDARRLHLRRSTRRQDHVHIWNCFGSPRTLAGT